MKKIFILLILSLNFFSLANAEKLNENSSWVILEVSSATTWSWENVLVNPIENISYTYYYGAWCKYCQAFWRYMDSVWGFEKLNFDRREVWWNRDNAIKMASDIERLWLDSTKIWVPFLIINDNWKETHLSWLDQLLSYFEPILWKYDSEKYEKEQKEKELKKAEENKSNRTIFLAVIIFLAILVPIIIILPKKK